MIDCENIRKYQTKIDFLSRENNQLRNENFNLQKLIKLQHEKQETLSELKELTCQFSFQQSSNKLINSKNNKNLNNKLCTCKDLQKTNLMLSQLFNNTMLENKRLVALISSVQSERDVAHSKALIHEQIMEGLQLEEIDIIQSLNGQILSLKECIQQQQVEINNTNKKLYEGGGFEKKSLNFIDLERVNSQKQKTDDKKTSQRVIELNCMLEQCLEQLNNKNEKIKSQEEQKNELIVINSKMFSDDDNLSSEISNMSLYDEVLPDKVNLKKDEVILKQQASTSPLPKNLQKHSSFMFNLNNGGNNNSNIYTETQLNGNNVNNSQQNMSAIKQNNDNTIQNSVPNQLNNRIPTNLNNSFQNGSIISNLNVPKLDLTKAFKVQQISVNNQMKQDQIKQQIFQQYKQLIDKQKFLQKRKTEKLISEEQATQTTQQIIQQSEELLKDLRVILEENTFIQEELKKFRQNLEKSYILQRQMESQIDTLQRDLNDAVEKNSILIQSNLQYENRWKKVSFSFAMYKDFYQQQQFTSQINTCSTRNQTTNKTNNLAYLTLNNNTENINIHNNIHNNNNQTSGILYCQSPHILTNSDKNNNVFFNHGSYINQNQNTSFHHGTIPYQNGNEFEPLALTQQQNHFQPIQQEQNNFFQQYEQQGQKIFEENDVQNSVFVPLSLRKHTNKKQINSNGMHYKKLSDQPFYTNNFNINEDFHLNQNNNQSLAASPFFSHNFQNSFTQQPSSQMNTMNMFGAVDDYIPPRQHRYNQSQVNNIQEAKNKLISLAQDLYFTQGFKLTTYSNNIFESPIQSFRNFRQQNNNNHSKYTNSLQQNNETIHKKRNFNVKSRSFSPTTQNSNSNLVSLPFRCFLKYKNIQPLRVFQAKTMAMHNKDNLNMTNVSGKPLNTEQHI